MRESFKNKLLAVMIISPPLPMVLAPKILLIKLSSLKLISLVTLIVMSPAQELGLLLLSSLVIPAVNWLAVKVKLSASILILP